MSYEDKMEKFAEAQFKLLEKMEKHLESIEEDASTMRFNDFLMRKQVREASAWEYLRVKKSRVEWKLHQAWDWIRGKRPMPNLAKEA
jgi:hypothetical protein